MVKVVHNIPTVLLYLPPQLSISSEVCSHPQKRVFARSFANHCLSSAAEPVSVGRGGFSGGVVGEEEETVGSGGTGGPRRWLQTGCRVQALISTGISERQYLFVLCYATLFTCSHKITALLSYL